MLKFIQKTGIRWTMALGALLSFSLFVLPLQAQPNKPPSPPKCEKCYRAPDGKIKCDPVPCPK
jgi:hypothetical protein